MQALAHPSSQMSAGARAATGFEQSLAHAALRRVEAKQFLFAEGDPTTHLFRVETGAGEIWIDGKHTAIKDDDAMIVPAGARHNVINTGDAPLTLYTLYGPPDHKDGVVRATKAEAEATEEHFDGKTTE